MKIVHVIDSLEYSGAARQVRLLVPALAGQGHQVAVCCLGASATWATDLQAAGATVDILNGRHWLDPAALVTLRTRLRQFGPDLVHVWRRPTLRALAAVAPGLLPRTVVSAALPTRGSVGWIDRWLLQKARCVTLAGPSDRVGLEQSRPVPRTVRLVPPAVELDEGSSAPASSWGPQRFVLCVGALEAEQGFRDAVWTIDILNYVLPDLHLVVVGRGPMQERLQAFARGLENQHRVHFPGSAVDTHALLRRAEVCWIPSRANCGRQLALEAMAAGCPVIASDVPCLREVIEDGHTGLLVGPGDIVGRARRTRALLQDAEGRARLVAAARRAVHPHYSLDRALHHWQDLYQSAA